MILLFLIVIAISGSVKGACTERGTATDLNKQSETDSIASSLGNFFMDVGCGIKSGAKSVKDSVETGYKFLKSKITSDEHNETNGHEIDRPYDLPHVPLAPETGSLVQPHHRQYQSEMQITQQYPSQMQSNHQYPSEVQSGQQYPLDVQTGQQYSSDVQSGNQYQSEIQTGIQYPSEDPLQIGQQSMYETTTKRNLTLDDRTALQTPDVCSQGEVRVGDKCRKTSGF